MKQAGEAQATNAEAELWSTKGSKLGFHGWQAMLAGSAGRLG